MDYSKLSQGLGGLLDGENQLLNIGMGILANNNDGTFGGAVGRGFQQAQTMQQANRRLKQEQELRQSQMQKYQDEALDAQRQREAIERFKLKYPELADSADLDPKAAFKAANPQLSTADPYFRDVYDSKRGAGSFNSRTGEYNWAEGGNPIIRPQDDPNLQGQISGSKSFNQNLYEPTNIQDGVIKNKSQLSIDTGAPPPYNAATPQTLPQMQIRNSDANPQIQMNPSLIKRSPSSMQIPPAVQGKRDDVRMQILLAEQAAEGGAGRNIELDKEISNMRGIRVPTKLETKQGEANIDLAKELAVAEGKAGIERGTEKIKNVKKADQFLSVAQQAKAILEDKNIKPTASGFGSMVDSAGGLIGQAPKGANEAARLESLSGWLVANVPRMEGPQSNFDVQNYQTMAGMIGDRTKPLSTRQNALNEVIKLQEKYKELNQDGNIMPSNEKMPDNPAQSFSALPKTAPKGQIVRNPTTGARKQFNGLSWVDIK